MKVIRKHTLASRWNHWINFPVLTMMIWSGMMIYWANPAYFIPSGWLESLGFNSQLGKGLGWHFFFGVFFTLNGFCYVLYLGLSGQWRYLLPEKSSFYEAKVVFLHDLGKRDVPLPKQIKYNGAQRLAYTLVLAIGFFMFLTGLAIYKPVQLSGLVFMFGGYEIARGIHFILTLLLLGFFVIHILQVVRAGWNNFQSMITGLERGDE